MFTHVLFDLDGTIVDSGPGILASFRHAFVACGLAVPPDGVLVGLIGPPLATALAELVADAVLAERLLAAYRDHYGRIGLYDATAYPGMAVLLEALAVREVAVALTTSKPEAYAGRLLRHLGLAAPFRVIAGATFDGSRVHKHDVIAHALAQLPGAGPGTAVVVGDRHHDVDGARAHGLRAVGVTWGFGGRAELAGAGAWRIVGDAAELAEVLSGGG